MSPLLIQRAGKAALDGGNGRVFVDRLEMTIEF